MEVDRKELSLIKEVLKSNPRGMTVTEISKEVKMNRHSVAKYLEVLAVSGHIDMKSFGPSKVYYISQRLPISAMLSFSSSFIIILDKNLRIVNVNDMFLKFMKLKREDIINKNMETFSFPIEFEPSIMPSVKTALDGKESVVEAIYKKRNTEMYFFVKFIPTVFDDAEKGVTVIFENVTERIQSERAIRESEEKFRSVIEQSLDGILLTDEAGKIVEFNKGLEIASGYKSENNLGKYIWESDLFSPDESVNIGYNTEIKKAIRKFLKTGQLDMINKIIERDIRHEDGITRTIQIVVFPIKTEKGFKLCGIARDITERKRIETELKNSEEQFRALAESTSGGIVIVQGLRLMYANHAATDILGYSLAELQEIKIVALIHPDHVGLVAGAVMSYKKDMQNFETHYEIKAITKAHKVLWVDITTSGFKFRGKPAIIITFFDISDRKRIEEDLQKAHDRLELRVRERTSELEKANATLKSEVEQRIHIEEALRNSKARYKYLVENINDIIWETDSNNAYVYMSPGVHDMLGYEPAEILGKTPYDLMSKTEGKRLYKIFSPFLKDKKPVPPTEVKLLNKDGHEVLVEISARIIEGPDGRLIGYNGIARDVTQHKKMEDMIRASEEKYRNLVEKINDWVWEVDEKYVFTYSSPKVKDILGYTPEEIIGKCKFDLVISDDKSRVMDIIKQSGEGRQPFNVFENTLICQDGHSVIVEVSGMPIFDDNGVLKGYRGIDRDVTSKKQAEEKLRWNETFLRTMAGNSPLALYAVDSRDGSILYYNKRFIEIWDLAKIEPFITTNIVKDRDLVSYASSQVEDASAFIKSCDGINGEESREIMCDELALKDGRIIRRFSTQIRDDGDRYLGRLFIFEDITERKRAEEALWESQRFLTTLIGNLPGMVYRCHNDNDWTMQYVSDGCYTLTGYQPSDLLMNKQVSYNQLVHPEDRERIRDNINKALSEGKPFEIEYRIMTASGSIKWVWEQGCFLQPHESGEKIIEGFISDITEKKAIEEKNATLASFPEMNPNPVIEINTKEQIVYMNPAAKKTFPGLTPGHPLIGGLRQVMEEFKSGGLRSYSREVKLDHNTYSQYIYYVPEKDLLRIYAANITMSKRVEEEAQIVNRALRMVNDCSQALVRATNEQTLLQDICRIIVKEGGYHLVWVGFAQNDESRPIVPVARMGYDNGYVDNVKASWGDGERSQGPSGTAIKTRKPSIARYTATDPNFAPWKEEALKRGYASTVSLPLISNERTIGVLSIYSTRADAFDSMELKLLMELADDLGYGITSLRTRAEHAKAEETLRLMKFTIDRINDAAFWIGNDGRVYYVNEAASRELGYSQEELLQMSVSDINPVITIDQWSERWEQIKNAKLTKKQVMLRNKEGTLLPFEITSNYIDFNGKQYDFAFARRRPDIKVEDIPGDKQ
jgi:PAS domain S-box-containing protein